MTEIDNRPYLHVMIDDEFVFIALNADDISHDVRGVRVGKFSIIGTSREFYLGRVTYSKDTAEKFLDIESDVFGPALYMLRAVDIDKNIAFALKPRFSPDIIITKSMDTLDDNMEHREYIDVEEATPQRIAECMLRMCNIDMNTLLATYDVSSFVFDYKIAPPPPHPPPPTRPPPLPPIS
jgi:hypothetical protein